MSHPLTGLSIVQARLKPGNGTQVPLDRGDALRIVLREVIETLRPNAGAPTLEAMWRPYVVITQRYIDRRARSQICHNLCIVYSAYHSTQAWALDNIGYTLHTREMAFTVAQSTRYESAGARVFAPALSLLKVQPGENLSLSNIGVGDDYSQNASVLTFSVELNRLLGTALLDPELSEHLLGDARESVISRYGLTSEERGAVMASRAHTLAELSSDLCKVIMPNGGAVYRPESTDVSLSEEYGIQPITDQELHDVIQRYSGQTPDMSTPNVLHSSVDRDDGWQAKAV